MKRTWLLPLALLACGKEEQKPPAETREAKVAPSDSTLAAYVPENGVDTVVSGDTTKYIFWSTHIDSIKTKIQPAPVVTGPKPFGGYNVAHSELEPTYTPFTGWSDGVSNQKWLIDALTHARDSKIKTVLAMPCGAHNNKRLGNCLRDSSGIAVFSWKRFDSTLNSFNTLANKSAVAKAWNDGTLVGINGMDEPWVKGGGDGNTWGPNGLSRAQADTVCKKIKAVFPNVPVGLSDVSYRIWDITNYGGFRICDFGIPQFSYRMGDATKWADSLLATANKYGYMQMFSFNPINGGTPDRDKTWDCKDQGGIQGQRKPNCQMTPIQITSVVQKIGDRGCGVQLFWRWDDYRFDPANFRSAFSSAAQTQKSRTAKPCKRR